MKRIKKPAVLVPAICLVLSALVFINFSAPATMAQEEKKPGIAPVNPEFQKYIDLKKRGRLQTATSENHALGLIPSPFQPGNTPEKNSDSPESAQIHREGFPEIYDLRSLGRVSSVKDQGNCGSCWAFATMGSLESHWLTMGGSESNLSENNLKECHNFHWEPCEGGNKDIATSYLSKNQGPISEANNPYNELEEDSCHSEFDPVAYVPDARYLPNDSNVIKQYLMDYGALYTTMYWIGASYNSSNHTYYYNGGEEGNHAITLVGWDDSKVTAGGTGAWILKNSWGADWGDDGYFYVSYNDTKINEDVAVWTSKIDYTNAKTIYMYDEMGMISVYGWSDETDYGLTKFVASGDQQITKVGTWIASDGSSVSFEIYDDFNGSTLSNSLGSLSSQSAAYSGYYTFYLSSAISISNGDDFYIKATYNTPGYDYPIPIEMASSGYASPTIETGKNWVSDTGGNGSWDAIGAGTSDPYDLGIRAYALSTETVATPAASPVGGTYTTIQSVTLSTSTSGASIYYTIDGSTPTSSSASYSSALTISTSTTLKAIAVKAGMNDSAVMSEAYTINFPQVATPAASPAGGTYTSNQSVTLSTTTSGAAIHYTTDGSTPTASSATYSSTLSISSSTTLKAIAMKAEMTDSAVMSEAYTINIPQTVASPAASPASGTYNSAQSVTLSTATGGATIHYTTDGSTPTSSSAAYSSTLTISTDTTLKAIAVKAGMNDSAVISESYNIQVNTDTSTLSYNTSRKARKKINLTFRDLALTKKKWVKVRINGGKVTVQGVGRSGDDSIVRIYLKYSKWAVGNYSTVMSYKNRIRVPYTTKKGKIKYRNGWESGTIISENIFSII